MNGLEQSEFADMSGKQMSILIVDDEKALAEMVRDFLISQGFTVDICQRGEEALDYLNANPVDCVLLDVNMPGMGGIEVAKRIREHVKSGFGLIPIILVSALDREEDKIKGLRYADDYVTKPFSFDELLARIRVHLRIGQLQNELLLSKSRYQCLYENIPEMCISLDKNNVVSDCNTMFCSYFGFTKEQTIGKSILDFITKQDHAILCIFINKLQPHAILDNIHIFQLACNDADNGPVYVNMRAVCLGEHETGLYIIVAMKDISENLKLERQQKLARLQLYRSARLASIGTLASGTAHEINNPLTAILGFSDALLHRYNDGEDVDRDELIQYLGIIRSESLRCRDVIENLSKFSLEYVSQTAKVSLLDCLHTAVGLMNVRAQKKNITITNNVSSDITVNTDAQKLGQVLVNILSNSIDFCEQGCTIELDVEKDEKSRDSIRLLIRDNGPGIAEEILPKIFDPFFTTKEVGKGIGLGMTISHKLMEECGGSIDVFSKVHEGTTVVLVMPRD